MNPEKPKTVSPEFDKESYTGKLRPYGEDPGDDCFGLPVKRNNSEVRYSEEGGSIVTRESGSTVHTQIIGNPTPENA